MIDQRTNDESARAGRTSSVDSSDASQPLYFLATLKIRAARFEDFCALMPGVVALMEQQGWRLLGSWGNYVGRFNVVTDLWRIPDANAVPNGFTALMQKPEWPDISRRLAECVEDETTQLMFRMPFDPGVV